MQTKISGQLPDELLQIWYKHSWCIHELFCPFFVPLCTPGQLHCEAVISVCFERLQKTEQMLLLRFFVFHPTDCSVLWCKMSIVSQGTLPMAIDFQSCSSISFIFCLPASPFKNLLCWITRRAMDRPCFSHVPTLFSLCASLVWHWLSLSAHIRAPLKRRGLSRQFRGGRESSLTTSCLLWLRDRCRLWCSMFAGKW